MSYQHAEAYALMLYRSDDGTEEEWIWNSRDGVTPFVISLRSGKQARHVEWHRDLRVPGYKPLPGSRMFVDMTPARAKEAVTRNAQRYWPDALGQVEIQCEPGEGPQDRWPSLEAMVLDMMRDYQPGSPDLVEVPDAATE